MSMIARFRALWTFGRGVTLGLSDPGGDEDPLGLFASWFAAARDAGLFLPEAMTLATATPDGRPSARMVLLKGEGRDGFVFFTNYESRKAAELDANPHAALVFHWPALERQVRVEGTVHRIQEDRSRAYFRTRARGSRLGAWASLQSRSLANREELEARYREVEARYAGQDVPLPPYWGGYRVEPEAIEFWQGRASRLHDRLRWTRTEEGGWSVERLYP